VAVIPGAVAANTDKKNDHFKTLYICNIDTYTQSETAKIDYFDHFRGYFDLFVFNMIAT